MKVVHLSLFLTLSYSCDFFCTVESLAQALQQVAPLSPEDRPRTDNDGTDLLREVEEQTIVLRPVQQGNDSRSRLPAPAKTIRERVLDDIMTYNAPLRVTVMSPLQRSAGQDALKAAVNTQNKELIDFLKKIMFRPRLVAMDHGVLSPELKQSEIVALFNKKLEEYALSDYRDETGYAPFLQELLRTITDPVEIKKMIEAWVEVVAVRRMYAPYRAIFELTRAFVDQQQREAALQNPHIIMGSEIQKVQLYADIVQLLRVGVIEKNIDGAQAQVRDAKSLSDGLKNRLLNYLRGFKNELKVVASFRAPRDIRIPELEQDDFWNM